MDKKSLKIILSAVQNAADTICEVATENYPYTPFDDIEIGHFRGELVNMCVSLYEKIDQLEDK